MNGEQLKARRIKAGLTQKELADKLGTFKQKISNWENGVTGISRLYIKELENILPKEQE